MVKCAKCSKIINKKNPGVQCNNCNKWYHGSCAILTVEQMSALSLADSVDWKCRDCNSGSKKTKRISVILPDPEEEDTDSEGPSMKGQEKLLFEIRQEVREMRVTVREIIRDELQSTLQFYSKKIDDYEEKLNEFETRSKLMDNQLKNLINVSKNLQLRNDALEQKFNKIEQVQMYNNNIEICGITDKIEDVKKLAEKCAVVLKQKPECIIEVHRKKIVQKPGLERATRAGTGAPIVVTLREGNQKAWLRAAKEISVGGSDLGIEGETKVYLRASLSPTTAYLLWKAKSELRDKSLCKYVWCKDGTIMVRRKEGDKKVYYVRSAGDIDMIKKEVK